MAFIVEMAYGKPHAMIFMDFNSDGELVPSRSVPIPENLKYEWREFYCNMWTWDKCIKMAKDFGWQPMGAILEAEEFSENPKRLDYNPSDYAHLKMIQGADAANLADALEKAVDFIESGDYVVGRQPKLIQPSLDPETQMKILKGTNADLLKGLIAFARKGPFRFAFDD